MTDGEKISLLRETLEAACDVIMRCKTQVSFMRNHYGVNSRMDKCITEIECFEKLIDERFKPEEIK